VAQYEVLAMQVLNVNSRDYQMMKNEELAKPVSQITEIQYKLRRSEPLSPEEQLVYREYHRPGNQSKVTVHLGQLKEQWTELAAAKGMGISPWIKERVVEALAGPGDTELRLREEISKIQDEVTALNITNGVLAGKNGELEHSLKHVHDNLMEATERFLALQEAQNGME
jgi:hypothetical protein